MGQTLALGDLAGPPQERVKAVHAARKEMREKEQEQRRLLAAKRLHSAELNRRLRAERCMTMGEILHAARAKRFRQCSGNNHCKSMWKELAP
eukprot:776625-Amphidinium_carterae.1